jgi:hypothetical protein
VPSNIHTPPTSHGFVGPRRVSCGGGAPTTHSTCSRISNCEKRENFSFVENQQLSWAIIAAASTLWGRPSHGAKQMAPLTARCQVVGCFCYLMLKRWHEPGWQREEDGAVFFRSLQYAVITGSLGAPSSAVGTPRCRACTCDTPVVHRGQL